MIVQILQDQMNNEEDAEPTYARVNKYWILLESVLIVHYSLNQWEVHENVQLMNVEKPKFFKKLVIV